MQQQSAATAVMGAITGELVGLEITRACLSLYDVAGTRTQTKVSYKAYSLNTEIVVGLVG